MYVNDVQTPGLERILPPNTHTHVAKSESPRDRASGTNNEIADSPRLCDMCCLNARLYKCPRCSIFTCSLVCCKKHKTERDCSGQRDRTAFVSAGAFDERCLRSDFHFLEDVLQSKDSAKRTLQQALGGTRGRLENDEHGGKSKRRRKKAVVEVPAILSSASAPMQLLDMHTPGVRKLVAAARERGVTLVVMPPGMTRRAGNTSRYDAKADVLYWKLHCVFVASSSPFSPPQLLESKLECAQEGGLTTGLAGATGLVGMCASAVRDDVVVGDILAAFLDAKSAQGIAVGSAAQAHALRYLRLARASLCAFSQWIPSSAQNPLFSEFSMQDTLRVALQGRTVVEYPTIIFGRREDLHNLHRRVTEVAIANTVVEESSEESDSDSDDGRDFMQALLEMRGKDVSALKSIIQEAENDA